MKIDKKGLLRTITLTTILLAIILFPILIFAQSAPQLSIGHAPTTQYLHLQPGETYDGEITFWNLSPKSTIYDVFVRGFTQIENYPGTAIIQTEQEDSINPFSASSWITTSQESINLLSNEYTKVTYTISVPEDAASGEHHASIFLLSNESIGNNLNRSQALSDLGAGPAILINVGDEIIEDAKLLSFTTDKQLYELPPVNFLTQFQNYGNTHVTPKGEIVLTNIFGQEIDRIQFNEQGLSLIRASSASYRDQWNHDEIFLKDGKLAIGPIKAKLLTTYKTINPGFAPISETISFWVVPWKHILAIISIIFILKKIIFKKRENKKKEDIINE